MRLKWIIKYLVIAVFVYIGHLLAFQGDNVTATGTLFSLALIPVGFVLILFFIYLMPLRIRWGIFYAPLHISMR